MRERKTEDLTMTSTNDRVTTIRTKRALYWASTGFAALALAAIGAADLTRVRDVIAGLAHLGYPAYFATIIGVWKLLVRRDDACARPAPTQGVGLCRAVLRP